MYKYLMWDIDGTILNFLKAEECAIKTLFLKYFDKECSDEMIKVYSKINVEYWEKLERNEMSKPEILVKRFETFFNLYNLDTSVASVFNDDYQVTLGDTIVFNDDAYNILLSEKNKYTLIAITNGTKIAQTKKLNRSNLINVFDYIYISEEVGYEKPNKEYFNKIINDLDIKDLKECLIIGDSLTSDIKGGLNMNIDTCLYNPLNKEIVGDIKPKYIIRDLHELSRFI